MGRGWIWSREELSAKPLGGGGLDFRGAAVWGVIMGPNCSGLKGLDLGLGC